jgi:putative oxidoreductase
MKKLFSVNHQANVIDAALLLARVGIGVLMLVHGFPKLQMLLSGEPAAFPGILGMSGGLSLFLAVFAEVVCSILLIIGLGTRLAVIPLIITMLVAVLHVHAADPFAKQEMGIHYLLTYVVLLLTGSGRYSVDYLLQSKQGNRDYKSAKTNVLISQ